MSYIATTTKKTVRKLAGKGHGELKICRTNSSIMGVRTIDEVSEAHNAFIYITNRAIYEHTANSFVLFADSQLKIWDAQRYAHKENYS